MQATKSWHCLLTDTMKVCAPSGVQVCSHPGASIKTWNKMSMLTLLVLVLATNMPRWLRINLKWRDILRRYGPFPESILVQLQIHFSPGTPVKATVYVLGTFLFVQARYVIDSLGVKTWDFGDLMSILEFNYCMGGKTLFVQWGSEKTQCRIAASQ